MAGSSKSLYFHGTRAAGATLSTTATTASKDLRSAIQTLAGGVVVRAQMGTETGTADVDIDIEDSDDNVSFSKRAGFTQITAAGSYSKDPGVRLRRFVRLVITVAGGGSYAATRVWLEYSEGRESGAMAGNPRQQ